MYRGIILLDEMSPLIQVSNFVKYCPIETVNEFIYQNNIEVACLNPNQITSYYTRPFALYFDLKNNKRSRNDSYDFLIINIHQAFLKFMDIYPEYWQEIQRSFHTIQFIK
jgi:hypothetical protein